MFRWRDQQPSQWEQNDSIQWRHLRIRPTQLGIWLFLVAAASWILAMNYGINVAYAFAFWIASFSLWSMFQAVLQLYGIRLDYVGAAESFCGDVGYLTVSIQGEKLRDRRLYARFIDDHSSLQFWDTAHQTHINLPFLSTWRGYMLCPPLYLYTRAPFALLSVECTLQPHWRILVYPAPIEASFEGITEGMGTEGVRLSQEGEDIAALTPYREGESLKRIAWKAFAKNKKLLSKQMESVGGQQSNIISYRDYAASVTHENMVSSLCYRVLQAEESSIPYILELPSERILPQNGQREQALTALAVL